MSGPRKAVYDDDEWYGKDGLATRLSVPGDTAPMRAHSALDPCSSGTGQIKTPATYTERTSSLRRPSGLRPARSSSTQTTLRPPQVPRDHRSSSDRRPPRPARIHYSSKPHMEDPYLPPRGSTSHATSPSPYPGPYLPSPSGPPSDYEGFEGRHSARRDDRDDHHRRGSQGSLTSQERTMYRPRSQRHALDDGYNVPSGRHALDHTTSAGPPSNRERWGAERKLSSGSRLPQYSEPYDEDEIATPMNSLDLGGTGRRKGRRVSFSEDQEEFPPPAMKRSPHPSSGRSPQSVSSSSSAHHSGSRRERSISISLSRNSSFADDDPDYRRLPPDPAGRENKGYSRSNRICNLQYDISSTCFPIVEFESFIRNPIMSNGERWLYGVDFPVAGLGRDEGRNSRDYQYGDVGRGRTYKYELSNFNDPQYRRKQYLSVSVPSVDPYQWIEQNLSERHHLTRGFLSLDSRLTKAGNLESERLIVHSILCLMANNDWSGIASEEGVEEQPIKMLAASSIYTWLSRFANACQSSTGVNKSTSAITWAMKTSLCDDEENAAADAAWAKHYYAQARGTR